jgi:O-succinylbenzoate synthase
MDFLEKNDIWISHYSLRSRGFLNSLSKRREFSGVLIRVGEGYGCIQPWPELGDPTLEKCLEDLRTRRFWPIVRRTLRCAEYDDAARGAEESLFEEMEIPRSHATVSEASEKEISAAIEAGFDTIKLKAGRNLAEESVFLETMISAHPQLKWRLDFNETLDAETAEKFLGGLSAEAIRAIDFLEDICPYSKPEWESLWKKYRVRLAVDRESAPQSTAAQVMVIKPAVDEPFLLTESAAQNGQVAVFTSYMDHPLGQAFAAWEAARMNLILPGVIGTCGLQTHHLFEKDAFTEALGEWKPSFSAPSGTGLGFDDQLAQLTWIKL